MKKPTSRISRLRCASAAVIILLLAAACGSGDASSPGEQRYSAAFGTGPSGGGAFGVGTAMAEILRKHASNVRVTAEDVQVAPSNLTRLQSGELQFAINTTFDVHRAMEGIEDFEGTDISDLQFVAGGQFGAFGIIAPEASNIEAMADLCGKKFAVASEAAKAIISSSIAVAGVDPDCIDWNLGIGSDQAVLALQDKTVDVSAFTVYPLSGSVQQLVETMDVTFLGIDETDLDAYNAEYPFFPAYTLEAGALKGLEADWIVPGYLQVLLTAADVDEDLVRVFTMTVLEHADECDGIFGGCGDYSVENTQRILDDQLINVPVHVGAERAYEELGISGQ